MLRLFGTLLCSAFSFICVKHQTGQCHWTLFSRVCVSVWEILYLLTRGRFTLQSLGFDLGALSRWAMKGLQICAFHVTCAKLSSMMTTCSLHVPMAGPGWRMCRLGSVTAFQQTAHSTSVSLDGAILSVPAQRVRKSPSGPANCCLGLCGESRIVAGFLLTERQQMVCTQDGSAALLKTAPCVIHQRVTRSHSLK